jgi:hypothetical protein
MTITFPGGIDTLDTAKTGGTLTAGDHAAHHDDMAAGVNALERYVILHDKDSVALATGGLPTSNLTTYSAGVITTGAASLVIDGVAVTNNMRILVKDQIVPGQNAIYTVSGVGTNVALTRAWDFNLASYLQPGCTVWVERGTVNAGTAWALTNVTGAITLGTTSLYWTRVYPQYVDQVSTPPAAGLSLRPTGAILESQPRAATAISNQAIASSGIITVSPLGILRAGQMLSSLTTFSGSTAGATLTHSWAGIARFSDLTILAISADDTTATWAINTAKTFAMAAAFTAVRDETLLMFQMIAGTTMPSQMGIGMQNGVLYQSPQIAGRSNTGQTTPLTVGTALATITTAGTYFYGYAS